MIRSPSPSALVLGKYLFGLLGLSLTSVACSGNVVVDGNSSNVGGSGSGSGGDGGGGAPPVTSTSSNTTSSASTTTSGAGGSAAACDVAPLAPDQYDASLGEPELLTICIPPSSGECLPHDDLQVFNAIAPMVYTYDEQCIGETGRELHDVPCGPDPSSDGCCYAARTVPWNDWCEEGRPFTVDGAARTAATIPRGDWHSALVPDVTDLSLEARAALARAWLRSAAMEHASVASFARFALELLAVGAPAALVLDAQKAIGDEIRHAQACFALAGAYAGEAVGPAALAIEGSTQRVELLAIAVATVREGCIGETVASLSAQAELAGATDPAVRLALAQIAEDEAFHAGLAWRFVAWAVAQGGEPVRAAVARAFAEEERRATSGNQPHAATSAAVLAEEPCADALRRHGRLSASEARAVQMEALSTVILPCARALLGRASELAVSPGARVFVTAESPAALAG